MRDSIPDMEYVFCDTGEELPETYWYLDRVEAYLGKPIIRLNPDRPFKHYLQVYRGVLPDARTRWCTKMLKIRPFERFVGDGMAISYVGIRADEAGRGGYISTKPNVSARYPFIEDGITREDVFRILEESGLELPDYYKWRSRSGCYFCFFQQLNEWIGLLENHPSLYDKAAQFESEKADPVTGEFFTWNYGESLKELRQPDRVSHIKTARPHQTLVPPMHRKGSRFSLTEILADDTDEGSCLICHL